MSGTRKVSGTEYSEIITLFEWINSFSSFSVIDWIESEVLTFSFLNGKNETNNNFYVEIFFWFNDTMRQYMWILFVDSKLLSDIRMKSKSYFHTVIAQVISGTKILVLIFSIFSVTLS